MLKKKILLVDDEEELVEMVKMRLEANGYEVITAHDGEKGLELARQDRPDLVILDVMLPKKDGYKVCAELKGDARFAATPVLLFTAKAQKEDRKMGDKAGASGYITKPFEPQALLSKIREIIV